MSDGRTAIPRVLLTGVVQRGLSPMAAAIMEDGRLEILAVSDLDGLASAIDHHHPDAILVDLSDSQALLPLTGLARDFPLLPLIGYGMPASQANAIACGTAGLWACLEAGEPAEDSIELVLRTLREEPGRAAIAKLVARLAQAQENAGPNLEHLNPIEAAILEKIGEGGSNSEVAEQLGLSTTAVKNYVHSILVKLRLTKADRRRSGRR